MRNDKPLVFLGGTMGRNSWRQAFIADLTTSGVDPAQLHDPMVPEWTAAAQEAEEAAKADADVLVFYIGNPHQDGLTISAYSLVEATMALYDAPQKAIVIFDATGIEDHSRKSMAQCEKQLRRRFPDAKIYSDLEQAKHELAARLLAGQPGVE